ncbi:MAG: hypothetical protein ABIH39_03710 [Candidatus Margulisiibacteriota bacterium]
MVLKIGEQSSPEVYKPPKKEPSAITVPVRAGLNNEDLIAAWGNRAILVPEKPMEIGTFKMHIEKLADAYQTGSAGKVKKALEGLLGMKITNAGFDAFLGNKDNSFNDGDISKMDKGEVLAHLNNRMKEFRGFCLASYNEGSNAAGRFRELCEAYIVEFVDRNTGVDGQTLANICGNTWGEISQHPIFRDAGRVLIEAGKVLEFKDRIYENYIDPNTQLSEEALQWLYEYAVNQMCYSIENTVKPGTLNQFAEAKYEWSDIKKERLPEQLKLYMKTGEYDVEYLIGHKDEPNSSYDKQFGVKNGTVVPIDNERGHLNIQQKEPKK